jgi:hypothetical protein
MQGMGEILLEVKISLAKLTGQCGHLAFGDFSIIKKNCFYTLLCGISGNVLFITVRLTSRLAVALQGLSEFILFFFVFHATIIILLMKAVSVSETSINCHETTLHNIPEDIFKIGTLRIN